jgi:hypothetical protein
MAEAPLPDLSQDITQGPQTGADERDKTEALLLAAEDLVDANTLTPDDLAQRVKIYEEKLAKDPQPPLKVKGNDTKTSVKQDPPMRPLPGPTQAKKTPKSQVVKAAKMAQKAMATAKKLPIKPIPSQNLPDTKNEDKPAETKPEADEAHAAQTPVAENTKQKSPSASVSEHTSEVVVTEGEDTLGDLGFPSPGLPNPSAHYRDLSTISSHHEVFQSDITHMAHQQRRLENNVGELNNKIAGLEATLMVLQTDQSKFMSTMMESIRRLEREKGNLPPATTTASAVVAPAIGVAPVASRAPVVLSPAEKQAKMAALRKARSAM